MFLKIILVSFLIFCAPIYAIDNNAKAIDDEASKESLEMSAFSSDLNLTGLAENTSTAKLILAKLEKTSAGEMVRQQILGEQNASLVSIFEDKNISNSTNDSIIKIDKFGAFIAIGAILISFVLILFVSIYITRKVFRLIFPESSEDFG